jgi:probable phosphoglycerate mutase
MLATVPTNQYKITFDGASRGNPGPGSSAAVLWQGGARVGERAVKHPRHVTNNEAEYGGLLVGLELARDHGVETLAVEGDSKLVIEHVFGTWKCKCPRLMPLRQRARDLVGAFKSVSGRWIPRERNGAADALCNAALDGGAQTMRMAAVAPVTPTSWPPMRPAPVTQPPTTTRQPSSHRRLSILEQLAL